MLMTYGVDDGSELLLVFEFKLVVLLVELDLDLQLLLLENLECFDSSFDFGGQRANVFAVQTSEAIELRLQYLFKIGRFMKFT